MKRVLMVICLWMLLSTSAAAAQGFPGLLAQYEEKDAVLKALEDERAALSEMYQASFGGETLNIQTQNAFRLRLLDAQGAPEDLASWFLGQPAFAFPFENPAGETGAVLFVRGESFEAFEAQALRHKRDTAYINSRRTNVEKNEGKWMLASVSYDIDQAILKALQDPGTLQDFAGKFGIHGLERAEVFMGTWGTGLWVQTSEGASVIAKPSGILLCYTAEEYIEWLQRCWDEVESAAVSEQQLSILDKMRNVAKTPYGKGLYVIAAIAMLWMMQRMLTNSSRKKAKAQAQWYTRYNKMSENSPVYEDRMRIYNERRALNGRKENEMGEQAPVRRPERTNLHQELHGGRNPRI